MAPLPWHSNALEAELYALEGKKTEKIAERDVLNELIIDLGLRWSALYNRDNPLLRLPSELTRLIFEFCVKSRRSYLCSTYIPIEIVISHVCHSWREIALDFEALWTHFQYDTTSDTANRISEQMDLYPERSRMHGLTAYFGVTHLPGYYYSSSEEDEEKGQEVMDLMASFLKLHTDRLEKFTFEVDSLGDGSSVLEEWKKRVSPAWQLKSLSLCAGSNEARVFSDLDDLRPRILGGGAPNLSTVSLDGFATIVYLPLLANVTTLNIDASGYGSDGQITWRGFANILSLPFLSTLSLKLSRLLQAWGNDIPEDFPVTMPSLKHLKLAGYPPQLLFLVRAPLLELLQLNNLESQGLKDYSYEISFQPPFPALRTVILVDSTNLIYDAKCNQLLANLSPNLVDLVIAIPDHGIEVGTSMRIDDPLYDQVFQTWSLLARVTLVYESEQRLSVDFFLNVWSNRAKEIPFTFRLAKNVLLDWKEKGGSFPEVGEGRAFRIEEVDDGILKWRNNW